ncbi:MAG: tetraacyldisaccharide 4'-kinase [Deltaproteobacteria bacterium]|jgi:tetraacyldisaccharide-1-P 4'-kinase|nr:tetraacyldisaccharide 4'-kinase [Deltaproteobacteria bacterium]
MTLRPPAALQATLRPALRPLGAMWGWLMKLRREAYEAGLLTSAAADRPVVSVGNLTLGGNAKTPMCLFLAAALARRGLRPAILSRGYGRLRRRDLPDPVVVSTGEGPLVGAAFSGDEPRLLALRSQAIVVCANQRRLAAEAAVALGADALILDDGFQHLALKRDLDILMIQAQAPAGDGLVFPAGQLREAFQAQRRAHLLVAVDRRPAAGPGQAAGQKFGRPSNQAPGRRPGPELDETAAETTSSKPADGGGPASGPPPGAQFSFQPSFQPASQFDFQPDFQSARPPAARPSTAPRPDPRLLELARGRPLHLARVEPLGFRRLDGGPLLPLDFPAGQPTAAFCGLARPEAFLATLAELDLRPAAFEAFSDHVRYGPKKLGALTALAARSGARWLLTTAKDAVKLPPRLPLPTLALETELRLDDPEAFIQKVFAGLQAWT